MIKIVNVNWNRFWGDNYRLYNTKTRNFVESNATNRRRALFNAMLPKTVNSQEDLNEWLFNFYTDMTSYQNAETKDEKLEIRQNFAEMYASKYKDIQAKRIFLKLQFEVFEDQEKDETKLTSKNLGQLRMEIISERKINKLKAQEIDELVK